MKKKITLTITISEENNEFRSICKESALKMAEEFKQNKGVVDASVAVEDLEDSSVTKNNFKCKQCGHEFHHSPIIRSMPKCEVCENFTMDKI